MEDEILELRDEIDLLTKRIELLEASNNRRRAFSYVKILVKVVLLVAFAYGAWKSYDYLSTEVPKLMDEKIKEIGAIKVTP